MKKNRIVSKKMSVVTGMTVRFGAMLVTLFVMVILHLLASSSCQQMMKTIGEKENELRRLEDAKSRESTRWEKQKTTENLAMMLRAHGLNMNYSKPDQVVRMTVSGVPFPGQRSMAKAQSRLGRVAQNTAYGRRR